MKILKQGKRNVISPLVRTQNDEEAIAIWRSDLDRILDVFNVRATISV